MHDAVVSKIIAASRGSPCDSMASCLTNDINFVALFKIREKVLGRYVFTTIRSLGHLQRFLILNGLMTDQVYEWNHTSLVGFAQIRRSEYRLLVTKNVTRANDGLLMVITHQRQTVAMVTRC